MKRNNIIKFVLMSIICFSASSIMIALFYFIDIQNNFFFKFLGYFLPALFWVCIACAVVFQILLRTKYKVSGKKFGLITFFKNKFAIIADIIMILSLIVTVIIVIMNATSFISFIVIAILLFSFEMHCILNGKYFNYLLKNQEDEKNEKEIR